MNPWSNLNVVYRHDTRPFPSGVKGKRVCIARLVLSNQGGVTYIDSVQPPTDLGQILGQQAQKKGWSSLKTGGQKVKYGASVHLLQLSLRMRIRIGGMLGEVKVKGQGDI